MKGFILILVHFCFYNCVFANSSDTTIYNIVEQMPRFPGCEEMEGTDKAKKNCADKKLLSYVYNNIKYPKDIDPTEFSSLMVVSFIIDERGNIITPKVLRGIKVNNPLLELVKKMPKWLPGRQKGIPVKVRIQLPLRIHLNSH